MRAGRETGAADQADLLPLVHVLPGRYFQFGKMRVPGVIAVAVVDVDLLTVASVPACGGDRAGSGRVDGLAVVGSQVDARMKFGIGIRAVTVAADDLRAVDGI